MPSYEASRSISEISRPKLDPVIATGGVASFTRTALVAIPAENAATAAPNRIVLNILVLLRGSEKLRGSRSAEAQLNSAGGELHLCPCLAQPVVEMRRRKARGSIRREGSIVQFRTEVVRMHVGDHQPLVFVCGQDLSSERVKSIQIRPGYLDRAVHRLSDR